MSAAGEKGKPTEVLRLDETQALRVSEQAMNAHLDGTIDRTQRTLAQVGIDASAVDLKRVGRTRGSIVHANEQPADDEVREALDTVRQWLRAALPHLLRR